MNYVKVEFEEIDDVTKVEGNRNGGFGSTSTLTGLSILWTIMPISPRYPASIVPGEFAILMLVLNGGFGSTGI